MLISMISRSSSKLGHVPLKSRSLGQIIENACLHSSSLNFGAIFYLVRTFISMISRSNLKLSHVTLKSRSLGPIMEKLVLTLAVLILVFFILGQNVYP